MSPLMYVIPDPSRKWDRRFLALAQHVSDWSRDPSTHAGAVIVGPDKRVISVGFNGFPQGMADTASRYGDREEKYSRIIHAEVNALLFARDLPEGCTLYTWPLAPCDRCCVQMLQAGIRRFVAPVPSEDILSRWKMSLDRSAEYIKEVGGILELIDDCAA